MAKMFYTMEEAAQKLGVSEADIKEMAVAGKLQQFRDRDKLMFKREQVDAMSATGGSTLGGSKADTDALIPLIDSGDTDAIDLANSASATGIDDPRAATGISVFDASEIGEADPLAQTQMTSSGGGGVTDDAELSLESVGSGSGLLDLTHESDDTSLGAELHDEIYPGGGEGSDAKMDSAIGSSGVFESAVGMEVGSIADGTPTGEVVSATTVVYAGEPSDPAGNGMGTGFLVGAAAALVICLIVMASLIQGMPSELTNVVTGDAMGEAGTNGVYTWAGILLAASVIMGVAGLFIGKAMDK